ncbi:MAG: metallophosphoesterase [Chitinophagaceae bacterium]
MHKNIHRRQFVATTVTIIAGTCLSGLIQGMDQFKPVRFGIVTDIHYAEREPQINRYYKEAIGKVRECIDLMNEQKVEFLMEIGDLKDEGSPPDEAQTLRFLDAIEKEFKRFKGPLYHVLGNHDHDSISKQQFLNGISNYGFKKALNYYSFNKGSFHFIVLDANYTAAEKEYDHGNFDWKDCHIPVAQLEWLKNDLSKNKKPTIVFVHQQIDSTAFEVSHRVYCPDNSNEVRKIIEDAGNVGIVFQGHYHPGSLNKINNIHYYTLKSVIEGSGPENNNYAIVEIGKDLVTRVTGFRKTISQNLT